MKIGGVWADPPLFLAPMAGITDMAFRLLCKEQGCGLMYTEMVSAKGLFYKSDRTAELLGIHPAEHPIGIQIFGSDPRIMAQMAAQISQGPADLIDINMGCPAPKIAKNGEGCALMRQPALVRDIVYAVAQASCKPVTVKIRKGWDGASINAVDIARIAEDAGAAAVTVHGRTREQFYSGKADLDIIRQVKKSLTIPVIGNGDIFTGPDAVRMLQETGCNGVMVARGALGNPWLFAQIRQCLQGAEPVLPDARMRIETALRHLALTVQYKGEAVALREMRKHIPWYLKGLVGCAAVKQAIHRLDTQSEMEHVLIEYIKNIENHALI